MPAKESSLYTVGFAAAVCLVCSILVATSAVTLKDRQEANAVLDRQRNVLKAAGLIEQGEDVSAEEVNARFAKSVKAVVINLQTGEPAEGVDPATFDQQLALTDPEQSRQPEPNAAKVLRVPNNALVYQILEGDGVDMHVLPIEGKGLWSTLYGFLAIDKDTTTVRGISFYKHGETPGLGGEVENPRWQKLWQGRKIYDASWTTQFKVRKGQAGPPAEDPHQVDGLSGATLTCNGVTNTVQFWAGDDGFGPYLARFRKGGRD